MEAPKIVCYGLIVNTKEKMLLACYLRRPSQECVQVVIDRKKTSGKLVVAA